MADIELAIKIPAAIYEASQILDVKHEDTIQIPLEVISNGTPFTKWHEDKVKVLEKIRSELWMEGMNLTGEYQGIWVRFRDIERIINKHIAESEK